MNLKDIDFYKGKDSIKIDNLNAFKQEIYRVCTDFQVCFLQVLSDKSNPEQKCAVLGEAGIHCFYLMGDLIRTDYSSYAMIKCVETRIDGAAFSLSIQTPKIVNSFESIGFEEVPLLKDFHKTLLFFMNECLKNKGTYAI